MNTSWRMRSYIEVLDLETRETEYLDILAGLRDHFLQKITSFFRLVLDKGLFEKLINARGIHRRDLHHQLVRKLAHRLRTSYKVGLRTKFEEDPDAPVVRVGLKEPRPRLPAFALPRLGQTALLDDAKGRVEVPLRVIERLFAIHDAGTRDLAKFLDRFCVHHCDCGSYAAGFASTGAVTAFCGTPPEAVVFAACALARSAASFLPPSAASSHLAKSHAMLDVLLSFAGTGCSTAWGSESELMMARTGMPTRCASWIATACRLAFTAITRPGSFPICSTPRKTSSLFWICRSMPRRSFFVYFSRRPAARSAFSFLKYSMRREIVLKLVSVPPSHRFTT